MTPNAMTRWYRAPEIIMDQTDYSHSVDNWGVGCTLAELIRFTNEYRTNHRQNKRVLFSGNSCYPMSPCNVQEQNQDIGQPIIDN